MSAVTVVPVEATALGVEWWFIAAVPVNQPHWMLNGGMLQCFREEQAGTAMMELAFSNQESASGDVLLCRMDGVRLYILREKDDFNKKSKTFLMCVKGRTFVHPMGAQRLWEPGSV
jgi:hypothetical protein